SPSDHAIGACVVGVHVWHNQAAAREWMHLAGLQSAFPFQIDMGVLDRTFKGRGEELPVIRFNVTGTPLVVHVKAGRRAARAHAQGLEAGSSPSSDAPACLIHRSAIVAPGLSLSPRLLQAAGRARGGCRQASACGPEPLV